MGGMRIPIGDHVDDLRSDTFFHQMDDDGLVTISGPGFQVQVMSMRNTHDIRDALADEWWSEADLDYWDDQIEIVEFDQDEIVEAPHVLPHRVKVWNYNRGRRAPFIYDLRDMRDSWRPDKLARVCAEIDNPVVVPDLLRPGTTEYVSTESSREEVRKWRHDRQVVNRFEKRTRERYRQSRRAREHARWNQAA